MISMEEIMGLYGELGAPGAEDELRRGGRRAPGGGGYEGIGGNLVSPGMFAPFMGGQGGPGFSGAIGRDFQPGSRGLASLMQQSGGRTDFQGPAFRNFTNQGFDFMPPGQDQRNAVGGPNIAPGNIDDARALNQPMGPGHVPGVPQGVAVGQQPGRVAPMPQTQGWRNVHPGYSAAAQAGYGTSEWGGYQGQGGGPVRPGDVGGGGPGAQAGGGPGRPFQGGPAELGQQIEQGPKNVGGVQQHQGGGGGGGSQGTTGGGGGSGKKTGGGGGTAGGSINQQNMPGNATAKNQNRADRAVVRAGTASGGENVKAGQISKKISKKTGGLQTKGGQSIVQGPGVNGPIAQVASQVGQGGKGVSGATRGAAHEEMVKTGKTKPKTTPFRRGQR